MPRGTGPILFVSLRKNGVTNIKQFTGKFSGGSFGSALSVYIPKVFKVFGNKVTIVSLPPSDGLQALQNGVIGGLALGHPNTAIVELAMTTDIRIIGITGEDAETFLKVHPEYSYPLTVPAGYYKGLDEPLEIVGVLPTFSVRDDLPEDMVYTMLKAWHKHQEIVEATWPALLETKGTSPDLMKHILKVVPLHKGSIKYYEELGVEIK